MGFFIKNKNTELNIIHIGKCGGSSVREAIKTSAIVRERYSKISITHEARAVFSRKKDFLIIIRNPISRLLSAFNWRYYLIVESELKKNNNAITLHEWKILKKYKSLDNLGRILYNEKTGELNKEVAEDFNIIRHVKQNISYYLLDSLTFLKSTQVFGVIKQESIEKDCEEILGVKLINHEKKNRFRVSPSNLLLSPDSIKNLKRFVYDDYVTLRKLYDLKIITKEGFELLEKDPSM